MNWMNLEFGTCFLVLVSWNLELVTWLLELGSWSLGWGLDAGIFWATKCFEIKNLEFNSWSLRVEGEAISNKN